MNTEKIPAGTIVRCNYLGQFEYEGEIVRYETRFSQYLTKVYRGTGHRRESELHDGKGGPGDCWYCDDNARRSSITPLIKPYDPTQGNEEDDI